ncbi:PAS domain S-box protein [bacterium]|nr:PAS domain S-box protein [bacterium]
MTRLRRKPSRKDVHKRKLKKKIRRSTIMEDIFKSVLLSAFITLFILMLSLGYYMYQRNIKYSISMLEEETKSISTEIDHYFRDKIDLIDILSYSPFIKDASKSKERRDCLLNVFSEIESKDQGIFHLFAGYEDNSLLIQENIFPAGYNFTESNWYKNAINSTDKVYSIGNLPLAGEDSTKFIISKSFSIDGIKTGVLAVDCKLDSLYALFGSNSMFESKKVMLVNSNTQMVLIQEATDVDFDLLDNHPEILGSDKTSFNVKFNQKQYLVFSHKILDDDWYVISRISYSEITSPILPRLVILLVVLVLITLIVSKIYAKNLGKTIAKPVIEVSSALQSLAKGNRNVGPIINYPKNEIGVMAKSFNTFLETTELLKADINELTETKADLSYSLSLLNASLESTDDGILILNNAGLTTKWNHRFLVIWGINESDLLVRVDACLMSNVQDRIVNYQDFVDTIKKTKETPDMISFDIIEFKNGRIIERYSFPQEVDGEVLGRVWRYRDVTKIKKSEYLLKDSEEKHRVMFTQTVDAYCILDDGIFVDVNQAAQDMLKSPPGWLKGKSPIEISPEYQPDGRLSSKIAKEYIETAFRTGRHSFYWIHLRYDGSEFPAEITLIKIRLKAKDLILAIWRDITEEREMAEKLKTSEQNYRILFDTMEDMIFISDYQGNIQFTNNSASEKLGYSLPEIWAMNILELHPQEFQEEAKEIMQKTLAGERATYSMSLLTKEGSIISVETKTWLGKWNGKDCIFGLSKDVSIEQDALNKFNKIFESNPNLIALSSYPDRKFIDVNENFCETLGYKKEEIIGKTVIELNLTMEISKLDETTAKLISEGNFSNVHLKVTPRDGKVIEGLFSGELIESNGKKFFLTVMTDITDMKQLDRKLRESERKYRLLFENMTTGFALHEMIYNEEGKAIDYRFLDVNPAFEQFTGLQANKLIGRRVKEVFPNTEDYWINTYGQVAKTRQSINYEEFSQEFDKYFEVRAFSPEKDKFAVIFSDSTSRVKALKELEREKELAQAATKAKSEFLANMSHEIRTPLNGVIGFTDLLLSTDLSENQKQFAINANVSGKALLGIISDILDFSKIEAGKMELDIVNSSVSEIMEQAIDIVKFSACKKGLDVILNIPVDFPDRALVDPLRLKQILLNLLNNAVKFTTSGEIELSAKFTPNDKDSGRFVFCVRDTGIGISEKASKRLFKAFSQADGSITRKYGGTGLGLVISNYFATQMGSHIDFISEEGKGSEFYFAIDTEYVEKNEKRRNILQGTKVLIADRNSHFMNVVRMRLEYWGIEVFSATDFVEITESLTKKNLDLLLIDERFISSDNYHKISKLLTQSKIEKKCSVVITYCPNDNIDIINISKDFKAHQIITKPLMINELFSMIEGLCSKLKATDTNQTSEKTKPDKHSIAQINTEREIKVLIAEDVDMNMALIKTLVKRIVPNTIITEAKNGMEAVHLFKEESPDLILMDVQMPELDGLEATRAIKKLESKSDRNTPIIALTAGAFSDDKEKCLNAGMIDFLTKPINVKELTRVLNKYLGE